jgi:hypothetical protein
LTGKLTKEENYLHVPFVSGYYHNDEKYMLHKKAMKNKYQRGTKFGFKNIVFLIFSNSEKCMVLGAFLKRGEQTNN